MLISRTFECRGSLSLLWTVADQLFIYVFRFIVSEGSSQEKRGHLQTHILVLSQGQFRIMVCHMIANMREEVGMVVGDDAKLVRFYTNNSEYINNIIRSQVSYDHDTGATLYATEL